MSIKIKMIAMALLAMLNVTVCAQNLRIDKVEVRGREIQATDGTYDLGVLRAGTGRNANEKKDVCKVTLSNIDNRAVEFKIEKGGMVFFFDQGTVSDQRFYPMTIQAGGKSTFSFICKRDAESSPMSKRNSFWIKARYLSGNDDASFETKDRIRVIFYGLLSDNELAFLERDGKWGAMDINQKTVIPFEYEELGYIGHYGHVKAKKNGKWGVFKGYKEILIPFDYEDIYNNDYKTVKDDGYICFFSVKKNGKWGVIDQTNHITIPFEYEELCLSFAESSHKAKKNGKWGKIDMNNMIITPFIYDDINDVK